MQVSVLGAGSWGSALAIAFAKVSNVTLWSHNAEQVKELNSHRTNQHYLPKEIIFADNIKCTCDFESALNADLIIIATPLNAIREILVKISLQRDKIPNIFFVSKGFEANTGKLPHQIIEDVIPNFSDYGLLIGPSFAKEVALGLPTAITLVSPNLEFAVKWMNLLQDIPNFRIYAHDDVVGSEVGAAIKNVLAIAVGLSDGLNLGFNARAALITRSLNELSNLVLAIGGKRETIYGLTGIGDLILTCTGDLSRNRQVGQELAKGKNIDEVISSLGHVAEGVLTTKEIYKKAQFLKIDMPIVTCVYKIIYENANIADEISLLIGRAPKIEFME